MAYIFLLNKDERCHSLKSNYRLGGSRTQDGYTTSIF